MGVDQRKIIERIDQLIARGEQLRISFRIEMRVPQPTRMDSLNWYGSSYRREPIEVECGGDEGEFFAWRTNVVTALGQYGSTSEHYAQIVKAVSVLTCRSRSCVLGIAFLRAYRNDIESGALIGVTELAHCEVFDDYLEMSKYLLEIGGYKDAAAVIAGSTLEAHMRRLAERSGVPLCVEKPDARRKKCEQLNSDLHKADVYGQVDHKQITAWLDLRNKAAHGRYSEYVHDQVKNMIEGVTGFIERYPA